MDAPSPFVFGRQLEPGELVDRRQELAAVGRALVEARTLFLIGPRRYGKTSVLNVACRRGESEGVVVLRYDAESFPTAERLVERLVADAASRLAGPVERAGAWLGSVFASLRPSVSFDPLAQSWSVSLASSGAARGPVPLLVDALDGVNRAAAERERRVAVVIDEVQELLESGGEAAEKQLRAAVQRHESVGYVFAGSKTGYLERLTGDPSAPFYNLGARLNLGELPDDDFLVFLRRAFAGGGHDAGSGALEALLAASERVPYNAQMLAHECWVRLSTGAARSLTPDLVRASADGLARGQDAIYTQLWSALTAAQRQALVAFVREGGEGLFTARVSRAYGTTASGMQKALEGLHRKQILRTEERAGAVRSRLQDPFFGLWVRLITA